MVRNKLIFVTCMLFLAVILVSFVSADFAVGFDNRIVLEKGQSIDRQFSIANSLDASEATIEVVVENGAEYLVLLEGNTYTLPGSGGAVAVPVRISTPSTGVDVGDIFEVVVSFKTVSGGVEEGGTVDLKTGHSKSFEIEVVEKPASAEQPAPGLMSGAMMWLVAAVVIVVIVVIVVASRRKHSSTASGAEGN
jgi:hypothetical protein